MKSLFILIPLTAGLVLLFGSVILAQKTPLPVAFNPYTNYPVYEGSDLGVTYSPGATTLKVWSPAAQEMRLRLYKTSTGNDLLEEVACQKDASGVWIAKLNGDRKNIYYTVSAKHEGRWGAENPDLYARAAGVNGKRGQIIDPRETDPPGWDQDHSPAMSNKMQAILYEVHVRDLSIAPNSGIKHKGKFLGFTETGTKNSYGQSTGTDHIAELGVTHVHVLPAFDFCSVDESKPNTPQYNWGYDPLNYNLPEGSYATDPEEGKVRIREFKEMVQAMHKKGLRVVMDVVYNHTGRTHDSNFDQLVPGYYYRQWEKDNSYSNASACGNETASDRAMMRKFIIESTLYWAKEYHIDGFRFDLMAIHDIETMNQIRSNLQTLDSTILIYGEGWTAGDSPLPERFRSLKSKAKELNGIAVFSDDIRDAIKGSVFNEKSTGFASGSKEMAESVKFGIVAAGYHPQVDYSKVNYSKEPYTSDPGEVINYVSCHDNHTLYDKLKISRPDATEEELIKMDKLANTIVLTSQGIPFLHAGVEMKRTKNGNHNSFNSPDSINQINWDWKFQNNALFNYYKALIAFRKAHPAFSMPNNDMIQRDLHFLPSTDPQLITYTLNDHANGDQWRKILVVFNGSEEEKNLSLPDGQWHTALEDYQFISTEKNVSKGISIAPISATILYQK